LSGPRQKWDGDPQNEKQQDGPCHPAASQFPPKNSLSLCGRGVG
jgi:hypothetical protein